MGWDGWSLAPAGTGAPEQERHHWLAGYYKQGTNGTDGLDGALVGWGWDLRAFIPVTCRKKHTWTLSILSIITAINTQVCNPKSSTAWTTAR